MNTLTVTWIPDIKGQLEGSITFQTPVIPTKAIVTDVVSLDQDGMMTIHDSFPWDYVSGPTFDWPEYVKLISLIHDAFCWLEDHGYITKRQRKVADRWFYATLKANGSKIWRLRWRLWYRGVRVDSKQKQKPKKLKTLTINLPDGV